MHTAIPLPVRPQKAPWNKGRLIGQKRPLKPNALFNLAIDSKLRGCDMVRLHVDDVCAGGRVRDRDHA